MTLQEIKNKKERIKVMNLAGYFLLILSFVLFMANPIMMVGFLLGGILVAMTTRQLKNLSTTFKEIFVRDTLKTILPDAEYDPNKGFDKETVYATKILKKEDRYSSEDYLKGTIKGRTFESADIHLQDVRSNGKSTTVVTVFQGRFFMIDAKHKFQEDVYVMPNRSWFFGHLDGLKKVDLESIHFNRLFDVFSKDDHSVFYLLTPSFMEKIEEFSKVARRTMFGFTRNRIYVAIDTRKDAFDLSMYKPVDDSFVEDIKKEVSLIEELIELIA